MIKAAWVTLKLHRVEVIVAATLALIAAAWATWVEVHMAGVTPQAACMDILATSGYEALGDCTGPVRAWGTILGEAGDNFRQYIEFLPWVVGSLVGVPIVARELESRTASMAWSMEPSRNRWLVRQVVPILVVVGVAMAAAAVAAGVIEGDNDAWGGGSPDFTHIGLHGPGLVARAFGALGLGVLTGVLLGRQLPAFLFAFLLSLGFLNGLTNVRDAWLDTHETHVLDAVPGVVTDWGWRNPAGAVMTHTQALVFVPPEVVAQDEGQVQPMAAPTWLQEHGYQDVTLGVSFETAFGWAPLEAGAYIALGLVAIATSALFVNRRRPA